MDPDHITARARHSQSQTQYQCGSPRKSSTCLSIGPTSYREQRLWHASKKKIIHGSRDQYCLGQTCATLSFPYGSTVKFPYAYFSLSLALFLPKSRFRHEAELLGLSLSPKHRTCRHFQDSAARSLEKAARACPGATRALEMAAAACPGATRALVINAWPSSGAARALEIIARACLGTAIRALKSLLEAALSPPERSRVRSGLSWCRQSARYFCLGIFLCYTGSKIALETLFKIAVRRCMLGAYGALCSDVQSLCTHPYASHQQIQ